MEAWAEGLLDAAKLGGVRPGDRTWWRRLYLLLGSVERRFGRDLWRLEHAQLLAGVAATGGTEAAPKYWAQAAEVLGKLADSFYGAREDRPGLDQAEQGQLRALWEETFGAMDDPETQARIAATVAALTPRPRR